MRREGQFQVQERDDLGFCGLNPGEHGRNSDGDDNDDDDDDHDDSCGGRTGRRLHSFIQACRPCKTAR